MLRRKVPAQVGPEPEMIPWWTLCGPQQLQKLQVRFSPEPKNKGQRATTADQVQVKGELLPEAGRPEDDTVQGGQSAGQVRLSLPNVKPLPKPSHWEWQVSLLARGPWQSMASSNRRKMLGAAD